MNEIPKQRPSFHLRSDFAFEIGFVDTLRAPVTAESFAETCRTTLKQVFSWTAFQVFNRDRAQYAAPRYILAGGTIRPGQTTPIPFLTDGARWFFPPPDDGLFADLLARVGVVVKPPKGQLSAVYSQPLETVSQKWTHPEWCVLHDAESSTGEVWSMKEACDALCAWHQAK